jgi:hypothetical protein
MDEIVEFINEDIKKLLLNQTVSASLADENLEFGDIVLFNNSFIFREKKDIKTTKSDKYIAMKVKENREFEYPPYILSGIHINADYRIIPMSQYESLTIVPLEQALKDALYNIGRLVFILIGQIEDTIVIERRLGHSAFDLIILDPAQPELVTIHSDRILVNNPIDDREIYKEIESYFHDNNKTIPNGLLDKVAESLENFKDEAIATLNLPTTIDGSMTCMLDSIISVLKEQRQDYSVELKKAIVNKKASNEILRIAYNFASDALNFLRLLISVCDLKPLILWGTINEHLSLAESLRNLPWHRSNKKPAFDNYRTTIFDARNRAFHDLFPFRKTLNVPLPDTAIKKATLTIFSEHQRKSQNILSFQDKELVDLLFEFTRARERQVPLSFWERNLDVMDASINLCVVTCDYLKILFKHLPD